jgi:hypothetical protein
MTAYYDWERIYLSAVYETDNTKMAGWILDARSAMEQPSKPDGSGRAGSFGTLYGGARNVEGRTSRPWVATIGFAIHRRKSDVRLSSR